LKTTYYLRSRSATHVEKSTLKGTDGKLNSVASMTTMSASAPIMGLETATAPDLSGAIACSIDNPECEACQ
jgi:ribonucleoside-diphosphate reductase alpha chain